MFGSWQAPERFQSPPALTFAVDRKAQPPMATKLSATGSSHPLPFEKLAPLDFERLCLWLVQREGYARAEYLGEAGSESGRDVVAWKDGRRVVFQCKRVKRFAAEGARAEIKKLRTLPPEEQPHELVFVVSQGVSAKARRAARAAWGEEASCHFWSGAELDERVRRHPDILKKFFQLPAFEKPRLYWAAGLPLLGITLVFGTWFSLRVFEPPTLPEIYAVRVQVLDPEGLPIGGSTVRASTGNEPQRLPDEWWEIEIPAAKVPKDGQITLWAEHKEWEGNRVDLRLAGDPNQKVEIRLRKPETWLRGRVVDGKDMGLSGVRVSRQDGAPGIAITDKEGRFALKLSVPRETRVRLRSEYRNRPLGDDFCYTDLEGCWIILEER